MLPQNQEAVGDDAGEVQPRDPTPKLAKLRKDARRCEPSVLGTRAIGVRPNEFSTACFDAVCQLALLPPISLCVIPGEYSPVRGRKFCRT